jgi:PAS domain S-box-containing protein
VWRLTIVGLAVSVGLALVVAAWLAHSLTRPLHELAAAAKAFGTGDSAASLPRLSAAAGDLGNLAEAFDSMRAAVRARETALGESEERYRRLVELSPDTIAVYQDGMFVYVNPVGAALFGVQSSQELIGQPFIPFVHPEYQDAFEEQARRAQAGQVARLGEIKLLRRDGTGVEAEGTASSTTHAGRVAVQVIMRDISDRKQAERAGLRSEKLRALGQMASGIAHDLNQSLTLIASHCGAGRQMLAQGALDHAELEDLFTIAMQAALDGGETVKRLLLFTRTPLSEAESIDLAALAREVAELTAPRWRDTTQAEGRPVSLYVEVAGQPWVLGARAELREALTNLVFNAVDALPAGGGIRLAVRSENNRALVDVVDTGVGMTPDVREHIFEPFFTTKGDQGNGLGLASVFGIVQRLAGTIDVESAPGHGTTVRLSFPAASEPARLSRTAAAPARAVRSVGRLRILTVDDEPGITRSVVRLLRPKGHVITTAISGEEALEQLASEPFDVVLSDLGMGVGMNGWELAAHVRERWQSTRFILATGWGASIDPEEARGKGVEAVLAKPYRPEELFAALGVA